MVLSRFKINGERIILFVRQLTLNNSSKRFGSEIVSSFKIRISVPLAISTPAFTWCEKPLVNVECSRTRNDLHPNSFITFLMKLRASKLVFESIARITSNRRWIFCADDAIVCRHCSSTSDFPIVGTTIERAGGLELSQSLVQSWFRVDALTKLRMLVEWWLSNLKNFLPRKLFKVFFDDCILLVILLF